DGTHPRETLCVQDLVRCNADSRRRRKSDSLSSLSHETRCSHRSGAAGCFRQQCDRRRCTRKRMSNRAKLFIPAAFFFVMLGLLLFGLSKGRDPNLVPSALTNRPLPEFTRQALFDPNGTVSSEQLKGGIFLVNFWGTWC